MIQWICCKPQLAVHQLHIHGWMTSGPGNLFLFIFKICFKTFLVRFHLETVPVPFLCNERFLLLWSSWSVTQVALSCDKYIIYTWSRGFQLSRSWELLSSWGYLLGKILTLCCIDPGQQLSLQPLTHLFPHLQWDGEKNQRTKTHRLR